MLGTRISLSVLFFQLHAVFRKNGENNNQTFVVGAPVCQVLDSPMKYVFHIEKMLPFWFAFYPKNNFKETVAKVKIEIRSDRLPN